ncbi:MAG: hypothetical protein HOO91_17090 [Bacteroidales bacterium]|nr:hypothetical protein [Bacteroidales bacterium]
MKKLMIITAFLSLLITPTFSQIGGKFKLDTTLKSIYRNPYTLEKSRNFNNFLNCPLKSDNLFTPNLQKRKFISTQNPLTRTDKPKSHGEMPCVVPEGYFPMRILSPDSSKRYSLLIKQL